jgi:DNA-binding transcriptional LysR family regulator
MSSKVSSGNRGGSQALDLVSITQALLVAECLSFRRAARMLGVRQSAVSRRVRALEDLVGVSLFERHHGGVRVTSAGARFLDQARDALLQLDNAVKTASAAGRGAIGRLNIGILSSMGAGFLREAIRVYRAHHPEVAMQVLEGASIEQIALVRKSRLDVAFVLGTRKCRIVTPRSSGPNTYLSRSRWGTLSARTMGSHGRHSVMSISSFARPRKVAPCTIIS